MEDQPPAARHALQRPPAAAPAPRPAAVAVAVGRALAPPHSSAAGMLPQTTTVPPGASDAPGGGRALDGGAPAGAWATRKTTAGDTGAGLRSTAPWRPPPTRPEEDA